MSERWEQDRVEVCNCGWEDCEPGHSYGPAVRDHYLIHYVASGEGQFFAGGRSYRLKPGEGFLILPGEVTIYRADACNPWRYGWVGYRGADARALTGRCGLGEHQRTFDVQPVEEIETVLRNIYRDASTLAMGPLAALGGLYRFLALIGQENAPLEEQSLRRRYCDKARWFMQGRYAGDIRVTDVADFVGLSRSQLFRVFREEAGESPKECLQRIRIEQAGRLLRATDLSVEEIALSVGMGSAQQLSAAFRKRLGIAPTAYRRLKEEDQ